MCSSVSLTKYMLTLLCQQHSFLLFHCITYYYLLFVLEPNRYQYTNFFLKNLFSNGCFFPSYIFQQYLKMIVVTFPPVSLNFFGLLFFYIPIGALGWTTPFFELSLHCDLTTHLYSFMTPSCMVVMLSCEKICPQTY